MEQLQLREKEIFETLKKIRRAEFVVIGGYAVNAYTLPRFSVDCDLVIKNHKELDVIEKSLLGLGYHQEKDISAESTYGGIFERYEKGIKSNFKVSADILIGKVLDRETRATFSASWVFDNSALRNLQGKTISENIKLRIINADALFTMKLISCRNTDIRDIFLLISHVLDKEWIKNEVADRCDLKDRLSKVQNKISSKQFKDELQGVFGRVDDKIFSRNKESISELWV
ncbi:nucleotidyl transferase AbiEii/AbiGii toxin family protein [Candidatus Woesearchaeota archaeon]|nr:nucleotidyl transferase AbiEii/AbiGii toxin family protein [Candidatus Woesearchaeota archaeon]